MVGGNADDAVSGCAGGVALGFWGLTSASTFKGGACPFGKSGPVFLSPGGCIEGSSGFWESVFAPVFKGTS